MQRSWRRFSAWDRYRLRRERIVLVQSLVRRKLVAKKLQRRNLAAATIQKAVKKRRPRRRGEETRRDAREEKRRKRESDRENLAESTTVPSAVESRRRSSEREAEGTRCRGGRKRVAAASSSSTAAVPDRSGSKEAAATEGGRTTTRRSGRGSDGKRPETTTSGDRDEGSRRGTTGTKTRTGVWVRIPPARRTKRRRPSKCADDDRRPDFVTPWNQRTKPQDPAIPLLSTPPTESGGDSEENEAELRYDWSDLWPRLERAGWRRTRAGRYNVLHDWYWIRPRRDPGDPDAALGVDYFASVDEVVRYQKRCDEEEEEQRRRLPDGGGDRRISTAGNRHRDHPLWRDFEEEAKLR